jgi:hypothetical protein
VAAARDLAPASARITVFVMPMRAAGRLGAAAWYTHATGRDGQQCPQPAQQGKGSRRGGGRAGVGRPGSLEAFQGVEGWKGAILLHSMHGPWPCMLELESCCSIVLRSCLPACAFSFDTHRTKHSSLHKSKSLTRELLSALQSSPKSLYDASPSLPDTAVYGVGGLPVQYISARDLSADLAAASR